MVEEEIPQTFNGYKVKCEILGNVFQGKGKVQAIYFFYILTRRKCTDSLAYPLDISGYAIQANQHQKICTCGILSTTYIYTLECTPNV